MNRADLAAKAGRPWGRVKGGHDEFTYPRQTPLPTGGRERTPVETWQGAQGAGDGFVGVILESLGNLSNGVCQLLRQQIK